MAADKDLVITEGSGKKKKLVIVAAVVVALLLAGAAYLFLFSDQNKSDSGTEGTSASKSAESVKAMTGSALYVPLPRPFVFNVPGSARDRMVQIKVQLLVRGKENEVLAMRHIPLIEGSLLETFSASNADDLSAPLGREALKNEALANLQQELLEVVGSVVVDEILFTGFVMQ